MTPDVKLFHCAEMLLGKITQTRLPAINTSKELFAAPIIITNAAFFINPLFHVMLNTLRTGDANLRFNTRLVSTHYILNYLSPNGPADGCL
jgi:hypothetical protein